MKNLKFTISQVEEQNRIQGQQTKEIKRICTQSEFYHKPIIHI